MNASTRVEEVFEAVLEVPIESRAALLERACGGDATLRREVESLLASHDAAEGFLDRPASELLPGLDTGFQAESLLGAVVGPFRVTGVIGSGGMSTVYEAQQEQPRRSVALKVSAVSALSDSALRRFRDEAEILGRLRHPGIAHVYEAGLHREGALALPYIAMELVPGARDIARYAQEEDLSLEARLELFLEVCDAVHHGHQRGILHRDLKPGNVLVDRAGRPKVIDYGVARLVDRGPGAPESLTGAGQILGTFQYMSPEQCGGGPDDVDSRTDVYSLGVILYELVTGKRPYDVSSASPTAAATIVREAPPVRPSRIHGDIDRDLEAVILESLEKDPERRYPSVSALAADLRRYLRRQSVEARPPSAIHQLRLYAARHRAVVVAAVTVLLALLAATLVSARYAFVAAADRSAAVESRDVAQDAFTFLDRVLSSGKPEIDLGRDRSLREVLDEAALAVDDFEGRPRVAGYVQRTLGGAYLSLGEYALAEEHLAAALALPDDALEPARRAEVLGGLSLLHRLVGDPQRAAEEVREALDLLARAGEAGTSFAATQQHALGRVLLDLAEPDLAQQAFQSALEIHRAAPDTDPVQVALVLRDVGLLHFRQGEYERAESELRRALELVRGDSAGDRPELALVQSDLATVRFAQGDMAGAETLWRDALLATESVFPSDHTLIAGIANNLGFVLATRGQADQAEELYRRALEIYSNHFGEWNPRTAESLAKLGSLLAGRGEVEPARDLLTRALAIREQVLPEGHPARAQSADQLGLFHWKVGEAGEALRVLRGALEAKRATYPAGNPRIADTLSLLAAALLLAGEAEPASVHALEAWEIRRSALGEDSWLTSNARSVYGECLAELGRTDEAEGHLIESAEALLVEPGPANPRAQEAVARVVALYESLGNAERAGSWRKRLEPGTDR